jgi:hypothetical protein
VAAFPETDELFTVSDIVDTSAERRDLNGRYGSTATAHHAAA